MPRRYTIGLVGTQRRQTAIAGVAPGDPVTLVHEPDNPYDERAIAVLDPGGAQIGYLPKDSWLADALIDEEKGCRATIADIEPPAGVRIEVELVGDPIGARDFVPS